jgi:hypothetical protein
MRGKRAFKGERKSEISDLRAPFGECADKVEEFFNSIGAKKSSGSAENLRRCRRPLISP